jgi:hypothetical protein
MSDSLEEAIIRLQVEVKKAKTRVRIKDECLKIAMATLTIYARRSFDSSVARSTLDRIEEMLAEIIKSNPKSTNPNFPWLDTGEMMTELYQVGAWTTDIRNEEYILTCAYCGKEYPPGTPTSNHEALTEHITRLWSH